MPVMKPKAGYASTTYDAVGSVTYVLYGVPIWLHNSPCSRGYALMHSRVRFASQDAEGFVTHSLTGET